MYVRTKEGKIFNCFASESMGKPVYYIKDSLTNGFIDYNEVYKISPNIIDIVQAGDYVNELPVEGYYTRYGEEKDDYIKIGIVTLEDYWEGTFTSYEYIKSIVTKEMFSSISYKVGE